ncbi:MAG TPA: hypothetical protein VF613_12680 [Longimicrobium sp.]|jgi:hypothetical protein
MDEPLTERTESDPVRAGSKEERVAAFEAHAGVLLAMDSAGYLQAIAHAIPTTVPAEVLVLCIRRLSRGGRTEEARRTLDRLILTGGKYPNIRYPYLQRMRKMAEDLVPQGQHRQTAEDLFQAGLLLVMEQLHTNKSAISSWGAFCAGRLKDARRSEWGRNLEGVKRERAAAYLRRDDSEDAQHDPLDIDTADGMFTAGNGDGVEVWLWERMQRVCSSRVGVEREVLEDLWFAEREPTPITELADRLGITRDRIYNVRRDAQLEMLKEARSERYGLFDRDFIGACIEKLPARRGSKPKRGRRSG